MYDHVLVPIALDHRPAVAEALKVARQLKSEGGQITALTVIEPISPYVAQYLPENQAQITHDTIEAELREELAEADDIAPVVIPGHAGADITNYARRNDVDCIVITSHRPGLQDYLLGSTAARVVRHASCAVHVVR